MNEREPSTPPGFMLYKETALALTLIPETDRRGRHTSRLPVFPDRRGNRP